MLNLTCRGKKQVPKITVYFFEKEQYFKSIVTGGSIQKYVLGVPETDSVHSAGYSECLEMLECFFENGCYQLKQWL